MSLLKQRIPKSRSLGLGLLTAASLLVSPLLVSPVEASTVRAVMHSGLRVLDPIITTAHITRDHGYMIYDTLLGMDEHFKPQPQMADWNVSDDGMTYTFTLRDELKWHDGKPVTAKDCVASLKRWAARDSGGQMLMDYTASLEATDERTITLTLAKPFSYVLDLLAKPSSVPAFMMPERIAKTPPEQAVSEQIGSGPFKFVTDEYQPGNKVVYVKNEDYVPRSEPASWTAGGKVVKVDRVEWINMPDAQTSINALNSGEVDYLEAPSIDLLPILSANDELNVEITNELGSQTMGRVNFLYPPFDNPDIRRAALLAMNQSDVLNSLIGNPEYYSTCASMYGCATPYTTDAGAPESLTSGGDTEAAKALLEKAGYDGTPIVLMQPTDVSTVSPQPVIAAQLLRRAGFKVDLQPMDWQTLVTRRASQSAPSEGGWNMFFTNWVIAEVSNPVSNPMLNGRGKNGAWFGWPDDPELEKMRVQFVQAETDEARKQIAAQIQAHAYETVNYLPLGEYRVPAAWSKQISGVLHSPIPVFWNVTKEED